MKDIFKIKFPYLSIHYQRCLGHLANVSISVNSKLEPLQNVALKFRVL